MKTVFTKDAFCQTNDSNIKNENKLHSERRSKRCNCRKKYLRRNTDSFLDMRSKMNDELNTVIIMIITTFFNLKENKFF